MPTTLNLEPVLVFLDGLSQNNQKAWFEAHRADYQAARAAFMAAHSFFQVPPTRLEDVRAGAGRYTGVTLNHGAHGVHTEKWYFLSVSGVKISSDRITINKE
jgi:hypothetical protein